MYNNNFNSIFNDFYDAFNSASSKRFPVVDVTETKESYLIDAELPGYNKVDVDLKLENHNLSITSSKAYNKDLEVEKEKKDYLVKETKLKNTFKRTFGLPKDVDEDKISAKLIDGVLTIVVPKSKKNESAIIQIDTNNGM
jgi:HSP20 family protein